MFLIFDNNKVILQNLTRWKFLVKKEDTSRENGCMESPWHFLLLFVAYSATQSVCWTQHHYKIPQHGRVQVYAHDTGC